MSENSLVKPFSLVSIAATIGFTSLSVGDSPPPNPTSRTSLIGIIDEAHLRRQIHEKQIDLDRRLHQLRDAIASLGNKHPSLAQLRSEAVDLEKAIRHLVFAGRDTSFHE